MTIPAEICYTMLPATSGQLVSGYIIYPLVVNGIMDRLKSWDGKSVFSIELQRGANGISFTLRNWEQDFLLFYLIIGYGSSNRPIKIE